MKSSAFKKIIYARYDKAGRHSLPWRNTRDPYEILVSEIMLQQTQVSRVLKKYPEFLKKFPTVIALAKASVSDVLKAWQGLGYNRRALNLKRAAEEICSRFAGEFPRTQKELESLPGIGQSTRGAVLAFAFDIPTAFIETNIRSVYIHCFSKDERDVRDKDLLPLIERTLDRENPREWYYALMDYGVHLKQTTSNPSRRSAHHMRQSPFKGSNREMRSRILSSVLSGIDDRNRIAKVVGKTRFDIHKNIRDLIKEGFIMEENGRLIARS